MRCAIQFHPFPGEEARDPGVGHRKSEQGIKGRREDVLDEQIIPEEQAGDMEVGANCDGQDRRLPEVISLPSKRIRTRSLVARKGFG